MVRYGLPDESAEYRKLRAELTEAEIALRDQRERVAELRRQLPPDTVVQTDYALRDENGEVRLSALVGDRPLVLMQFMYGKAQTRPCPLCTLWADGYNGILGHLAQRVDFAVLIAGDVGSFSEYAKSRGWNQLRILSAGDSTLKSDLGFETDDGGQMPGVSVFVRGDDASVRHFYSGGAFFGGDQFRGMDLLSPFWHFLDLTPEGRGDFMPSTLYK